MDSRYWYRLERSADGYHYLWRVLPSGEWQYDSRITDDALLEMMESMGLSCTSVDDRYEYYGILRGLLEPL